MIKTIEDFDKFIFDNFNVEFSDINEVNSYEHYNLVGDNEHDYTKLARIYKIMNQSSPNNDYKEIFILLFTDGNQIYDSKQLGEGSPELEEIWKYVQWKE